MNRRQKIVKGSCTNCGLSDHDAKHCLERPRKVPARFLHNNQVQEPNVREVAAPKDEWDKYLLKKQEEKELRRSTGGGVRSFRCREDIPEYLRKPVKLDKDKDKYKAFGDLTAHYDPRVRFNYRKKISAGKENFELGVPLCMTSWMDTEIGVGQDPAGSSVSQAETKEMTASSIHVGIVDYARTPEEVQQHFQSRGTVNRVTILTDKFGQPEDAVQNAPA